MPRTATELGALIEKHGSAVFAIAFCVTGDRSLSEDVAQEAFLRAWQNRASLRDESRFRQWVCGIARNIARNENRRRSRIDGVGLAGIQQRDDGKDPRESAMDREIQTIMWSALREIPDSYREVLALYYREGRSAKDVATALGISESLVLQRLHRGREHLKAEVNRIVERGLERLEPPRSLSSAVIGSLPGLEPVPALAIKELIAMKGMKIAVAALAVVVAAGVAWTTYRASAQEDSVSPPPDRQTARPESPRAAASSPEAATSTPARRTSQTSPRPVAPTPQAAAGLQAATPKKKSATSSIVAEKIDPELLRSLQVHVGHARGPDDAPVSIVVYTDFSCYYCGKLIGTLDQLREEMPDKVRVVKKLFPLKPSSRRPAQASIAASEQGKFWEMHDLIFANQGEEALGDAQLIALAKELDLDLEQFAKDLESETVEAIVQQEIDEGKALGVRATPTLFVNNNQVIGARPVDAFRDLIQQELEAPQEPEE